MLSIVDTPMTCIHSLFCLPKVTGGGRLIVDCSLPMGHSVNNYTRGVAPKCKYKSIDDVAELMIKGDYFSVISIQDAYRAIAINPKDSIRQGLCWKF